MKISLGKGIGIKVQKDLKRHLNLISPGGNRLFSELPMHLTGIFPIACNSLSSLSNSVTLDKSLPFSPSPCFPMWNERLELRDFQSPFQTRRSAFRHWNHRSSPPLTYPFKARRVFDLPLKPPCYPEQLSALPLASAQQTSSRAQNTVPFSEMSTLPFLSPSQPQT